MKKTLSIALLVSLVVASAISCTKYNKKCTRGYKNKQWINRLQYQ